jgi:hypothetical protein
MTELIQGISTQGQKIKKKEREELICASFDG